MTETKQTGSEKSQAFGFKFFFGNCEEMFKKMQNFCGNKSSSDCCSMAKKMFDSTARETDTSSNGTKK